MQKNRTEQLLALLKDAPNDSFVLFALAKEYQNIGQPKESLEQFKKLYGTDPNYIGLYYHMGALLKELDQIEEARTIYQEGIKIADKLGDLHAKSELMSALQLLELELE